MAKWLLRRRKLGRGSCCALEQLTNGAFRTTLDPQVIRDGDTVIRWGCTSTIAANTANVVNKSAAIHLVNNKTEFRRKCIEEDVAIPDTLFCATALARQLRTNPEERWIARPERHAQGRRISIVTLDNIREFARNLHAMGPNWYASRFIDKDREYRIYIVKGRVVCVAEKTPPSEGAVAWNHALGGHFNNVRFSEWPITACVEAVKAFNISGLDFGGVDVIQKDSSSESEESKAYVLEINSAPTLSSRYRQECFAKAFSWEEAVPAVNIERVRGWRRLVHPAISGEMRND